MNESPSAALEVPPTPTPSTNRFRVLAGAIAALILFYSLPLLDLLKLATSSELYSHVILVPFVTGYLIWLKRGELRGHSEPSRVTAMIAALGGALLLITFWILQHGIALTPDDRLALLISSFVLLVVAACAVLLGRQTLVAIAFPLGFLLCMVPFPTVVVHGIETFFQHTSAAAAAGFFELARTPFFREGTFFQLPGINLEVAPECSGIRSSLALFITSLVAGHLFLRSNYKRLLLVCVVIPLAILRNGLRIFVIGELCVHISPDMIHSYIHRQGGPLFFGLSLIPFTLFLYLLVRSDRKKGPTQSPAKVSEEIISSPSP